MRDSAEAKTKLLEEERAKLRKEIKNEFRDRLAELENNILAYQDLLIQKETDIKAYALELTALQKFKAGSLNEAQLIESLKKLVAEKQHEIESLRTTDIQVGGLPSKVYKKLEHVNAEIESKMKVVHSNYKKEILKMTESFLKEIEQLKKDKQEVIDSIPQYTAELKERHKVEIEGLHLQLLNHKEAYKNKSQESIEFQKKVRELGDEIYEIETKFAGLEAKHKRCHAN